MTFADTFDGTSLDPTWTLEAGTPATTLEVGDGECRITAKPGASYEAPSQTAAADTSFGIAMSASDAGVVGDFDVAVQAPTSLRSWTDQGWGVAFYGAAKASNHMVVEQRARDGDVATSTAVRVLSRVSDTLTTHVNDLAQNREQSFVRVARSTNTWTVYTSWDGVNWENMASFSAAFNVATVKVYGTTFNRDLGMTLRITRTYDVTGNDLREAAGTLSGATTWSTDFTSGIPAWLEDRSSNGGTATVVSDILEMTKTTANASSAMVAHTERVTDVDLLVKFRINTDQTGSPFQFLAFGIAGQYQTDQYSLDRSHIIEVAEDFGDVFPLHVHLRNRNSDFNAIYDFSPDLHNPPDWANDVWLWVRFQRIGARVRYRGWADGDPEPGTWDFDGHNELWKDRPGRAWVVWAQNTTGSVSTTILVDEITIQGVEVDEPELEGVDALPGMIGRWRSDSLDGVADTNDVEGWEDIGPRKQWSLWPADTDRPTYELAEIGGENAVRLSALGAQRLRTRINFQSWIDRSAVTMVTVLRMATTAGTQVILDGSDAGGLGRNAVFLASGNWQYFAGSAINSGDAADTNDHVVTTTFAATRVNSAQYLDGTEIGTGDPGADILNPFYVGSESTGSNPADVFIAEIFLFADELDADERAILHSYVQDRYGIAVSDYIQFHEFGRAIEVEIARNFAGTAISTGAIIDAVVAPNGGQQSLPKLTTSQAQGRLLLVAAADRSGGNSASFIAQDTALDNAVQQGHEKITLAGQSTNRRSVYLFAGVIPEGVASDLIDVDVFSGGSPVNHGWVAAIIDVTAASLVAVADDDSNTSDVTSQDTGTTSQVAASDVVIVAAEVARGDTTAVWSTTDNTPPNPAGGDWGLSIPGGSSTDLHLSMGLAYLTGQAAQTWSDDVTYGTARQSSALILVFLIDPTAEAEFSGEGTLTATFSIPGQVDTGIIRGDGTALRAYVLNPSDTLVELDRPFILPS